MGAEQVAEAGVAGSSKRRAQDIGRARRRRRRPNIIGERHTVEVVLSAEEWAAVRRAADEANTTVPWYLVQSAVNPVPVPSSRGSKGSGPWLPWPKRQALAAALVSATGALDEVRLQELAKIGGNLNQIAHSANITGTVAEEVLDTVAELRETMVELRERAARMEELAREVTRR